MTDLTSTISSEFLSDASAWTLSSYVCSGCSLVYTTPPNSCGISQEQILGGPNILGPSGGSTNGQYFQRYYDNLDSQYAPSGLEFDLWVFYSSVPSDPSDVSFLTYDVDTGDGSILSTSATLVSSCTLDYIDSSGAIIKAFYKLHVRMFFNHQWVQHVNVQFISGFSISSKVSSFGFRNFQYYFDLSIAYSSPIIPANFPCYTGSYWDGSVCSSCFSYCKTCTGTSNGQCTSCKNGYYDYGNGTCLSACSGPYTAITSNGYPYLCQKACPTTYYWFYNQSCSDTCDSPLISSTGPDNLKICSNPCYYTDTTATYVNTYLYPDQTCSTSCSSPAVVGTPYLCGTPCANSNYYAFQNESCTSNCGTPLVGSSAKGIFYCNSPCPGEYIYPSGTCETDCGSILVKKDESIDIKFCVSPCTNSNDFVFQNGSCTGSCVSPLVGSTVDGIYYCNSPCPGEYIYPDGTCETDCASILLAKDDSADIKFCVSPCSNSNDYVFKNGSCTSDCISLLVSSDVDGILYCNSPCPGEYIYPDGTCQTDCTFPMVKKDESDDIKFCIYPCANTAEYFYVSELKCEATCPYPYVATESPLPKLCSSSLSEEQAAQVKSMASATNSANTASSTGIIIGSLLSSSDSTTVCMGPFSKMLQYIKYMNIVYPEKVQLMLKQQSANSGGDFSSKVLGDGIDKFPERELPGKFKAYSANSSFFVNFWPAMFNLAVILTAVLVIISLRCSLRTCSKIQLIVGHADDALRWNVFLIIFCGNFGDIVLFTALELQTTKLDNAYSGISFGLCLLMNLLCFYVVIKILDVNSAVRKSRQRIKEEERIEKDWCNYKALFTSYKSDSYFQQVFLFVFLIRITIFNGIIGYLYEYPLLQAVIINLANVLILVYLLWKRPIKQLVNLIQQIILELVLLPFNLCVLILAVFDAKGMNPVDEKNRIGDIMVYINVVVPILAVILMAIKFLVMGYLAFKQWRASKVKEKGNSVVQIPKIQCNGEEMAFPNRVHGRLKNYPLTLTNDSSFTQSFESNINLMQTLEMTTVQNSHADFSVQDLNMNSLNPSRKGSGILL